MIRVREIVARMKFLRSTGSSSRRFVRRSRGEFG